MQGWRRHFFYTAQSTRTTWTFRLAVLAVVVLCVMSTRGWWTRWIGQSLVCASDAAPSDALLLENFDPNYLLFERAEALERRGLASWALVPVETSTDPSVPNAMSRDIAEAMARRSRLPVIRIIPIQHVEPISLNAAAQILEYLRRERVRSVIVVAPGFRSRRSQLVYRAVLGNAGIQVRCEPVFGRTTPERWTKTWHGIQEVVQEFSKLQYYRLYVLPFRSPVGG